MGGLQEVVLEVARRQAEAWTNGFLAAGALAVAAEDADAGSSRERARYGEPATPGGSVVPGEQEDAGGGDFGWERTRLAVLLAVTTNAQALVADVANTLEQATPAIASILPVAQQDWVRATQAQFEPIEIGRRLLIAPSWHAQVVSARVDERIVLIIDPGLAFGTGSHPTTRLCLQWLDQANLAGKRVIDYGCGSGILAIAAARLGAGEVTGIDIDPQALGSAAENARVNRVRVDVRSSSLPMPAPADLVIANILANPLALLAPLLASLVAPGGALVLCGVLERQVPAVARCYAASLPVAPWQTLEGWSCLVGTRSA